MSGASSSELRSAIVAETTAGTTPATPAFSTLDNGLMLTATPTKVGQKSLTAGGATVGDAITGIDVTGSWSGNLTYGTMDALLETLLQGAWSSDVLKNGKAVSTVTAENTIPAGSGGTSTMLRFEGVEATNGTLTCKSNEPINLSLDLVGRSSSDATTSAIAGATYTDPTEVTPLTSGVDVGTIVFDGYTLDCINEMEISFAHEGRERQGKIATTDACGFTRGVLMPKITARIFLEANFLTRYNAARSNTTAKFAVTIPLGSVSGSKYTLVFHACSFESADLDFSQVNAMQNVVITPHFDRTTEDAIVTLTRAVA